LSYLDLNLSLEVFEPKPKQLLLLHLSHKLLIDVSSPFVHLFFVFIVIQPWIHMVPTTNCWIIFKLFVNCYLFCCFL